MKKIFGMVSTRSSQDYTPIALQTFFATTALNPEDRFILIDNDSSLDSSLVSEFPKIELHKHPSPMSFAQNANLVLEMAMDGDFDYYFLNNDLVFTESWLDALATHDPAIVIPLSNLSMRLSEGAFTSSPIMELSEYIGHEAELNQAVSRHRLVKRGYASVIFSPFFCVRIHPEVYRAVGLLDTSFGKGGGEDGDYSLRAALLGYPLLIAQDSWILHFVGRSTWRGAESEAETRERDQRFLGVFAEKWGEALSRLIIFQNDSFLRSSRELRSLLSKEGYRGLVQRLAGDRCKRYQWHPKLAATLLVESNLQWLGASVAGVYDAVDRIFVLTSQATNEQVRAAITSIPDPQSKLQLVDDAPPTAVEAFNLGLSLAKDRHFDYCTCLRGSEIFDPELLRATINFLCSQRHVAAWLLKRHEYWNTFAERLQTPETLYKPTVIKCGAARFIGEGVLDTKSVATIPDGLAAVHGVKASTQSRPQTPATVPVAKKELPSVLW